MTTYALARVRFVRHLAADLVVKVLGRFAARAHPHGGADRRVEALELESRCIRAVAMADMDELAESRSSRKENESCLRH